MPTRDQMWKALCCLDKNAYIITAYDGTWFVHLSVEIGDGTTTLHSVVEYESSPDLAIAKTFYFLTMLPKEKYIVTNASDEQNRRHYRWDEFMWTELKVKN